MQHLDVKGLVWTGSSVSWISWKYNIQYLMAEGEILPSSTMTHNILQSSQKITIESDYKSGSEGAQGLWVYNQEGSLQAVCEGNPGQIPEDQHEAKTIVYNVHGCQNSLLF